MKSCLFSAMAVALLALFFQGMLFAADAPQQPAQPVGANSAITDNDAQGLYEEGERLKQEKRYAEAAELYKKAAKQGDEMAIDVLTKVGEQW